MGEGGENAKHKKQDNSEGQNIGAQHYSSRQISCCQEHEIQSCPTRVRIRLNKSTNWKYEVAAQNPKACISKDANPKVTLYPEDTVKDANMNAAIGVDNKQFSKCGRHYGIPVATKEKILEIIQNSTIKVGSGEIMNNLAGSGQKVGHV